MKSIFYVISKAILICLLVQSVSAQTDNAANVVPNTSPASQAVMSPQASTREATAQLLQWLGVLPALRQIPQVVEMSVRGELMTVPSVDAVQATQTILQKVNSDELQSTVIDYVNARIDERSLSRAKNLLEQSVPVAIRQADMIMQNSSAVAEMNEFQKKMAMQPSVNSRAELVADLNRIMRTSLIAVQIQTGVDQLVNQQLAKQNLVVASSRELIPQKLEERQVFMQQRTINMMLFAYKDIRASELRDMVVLMSDNSIQKLFDLSQQGIEVALREISP